MKYQQLCKLRSGICTNDKKERVQFDILSRGCNSGFYFTGKQSEIFVEASVFSPKQLYMMHLFFPYNYEIKPVDETLESVVIESLNPDYHSHHKRKSDFEKIIPELRINESGVAFEELKSNTVKVYDNRDTYGLKFIASASKFRGNGEKRDFPVVIILSDLETDEIRHSNSDFCVKTEDDAVKIINKSGKENSCKQDEKLFWNQLYVPHGKLFNCVIE